MERAILLENPALPTPPTAPMFRAAIVLSVPMIPHRPLPDGIPAFTLRDGPVARYVLTHTPARDYNALVHWVWQLPYGRTSDRGALDLVLSERRGTCSTKHALLAAVAHEHYQDAAGGAEVLPVATHPEPNHRSSPVSLMLGVFDMHADNTPGVGPVLRRYGLESIPEAHCYLQCGPLRLDITHPAAGPILQVNLRHVHSVAPSAVETHKVAWHQAHLATWVATHDPPLPYSPEQIWAIREQCISALSHGNTATREVP